MRFNENQAMVRTGSPTPQTVIFKSESHKLHQAFPVAKDDSGKNKVIVPGQPVMLNTDGTIEAYFGTGVYLGIAVNGSEYPVYPEGNLGSEVTVAVEGFMVVYGHASGEVAPGYVAPEKLETDSQYVSYKASAGATNFIAMTAASEAGELIQVLVK